MSGSYALYLLSLAILAVSAAALSSAWVLNRDAREKLRRSQSRLAEAKRLYERSIEMVEEARPLSEARTQVFPAPDRTQ